MNSILSKTKIIATAVAVVFGSGAAAEQQRVIVGFKNAQGRTAVINAGGLLKRDLSQHSAAAFEIPANAINGLSNNPNIEFIEADAKRYPSAQKVPYGIPMVQADLLSDSLASNKKVCIIDSGYNLGHEDLPSDSIVNGSNDPQGAGNWFEDTNSHGTHVAGTIAALNNSTGVVGVLPNGSINLHIVKVFDENGWAYSSGLVAALDECIAAGSDVINMSLGGSFKSRTEDRAFNTAYQNGILSVAAAGNDGNTRHSYPASYDSVISVAAIDSNRQVASFSQQTSQVELAAPGVDVDSTVPMNSSSESFLDIAAVAYTSAGMEGSPVADASGELVSCGLGETPCSDANGKICLIQRGNISFSDKVLNCESGGGVGAIIYNNEPGLLYGTLGGVTTSIPSIGISDTDGAALLQELGQIANLSIQASHYAKFNGTSMASPHVAGVAALVWSYHENCTATEIRYALQAAATDLGEAGRDNAYGFGLVQAKATKDYLDANPCGTGSGGGDNGDGGGGGKPDKPCKGKKCN